VSIHYTDDSVRIEPATAPASPTVGELARGTAY
jgi:hypothetical protein